MLAGIGLAAVAVFMLIPVQPVKHSLNDDRERASYALGVSLATGLVKFHPDLNPAQFQRGAKDALSGGSLLLSASEINSVVIDYRRRLSLGHPAEKDSNWLKINYFSSFRTKRDKVSYAFGADAGLGWKRLRIDFLPDIVAMGTKDMSSGSALLLSQAEVNDILSNAYKDAMARMADERKKLAEENKKKGESFLAQNQTKPGVNVLPCGLQYKIVAEGSGDSPEPGNFVLLKYRGIRIDGTVFDSSDKPCVFAMGGILRGWSEALQLMKPGAKWQLFIPAEEAYGESGGPNVAPNEAVVYELELDKVLKERPPVVTTND